MLDTRLQEELLFVYFLRSEVCHKSCFLQASSLQSFKEAANLVRSSRIPHAFAFTCAQELPGLKLGCWVILLYRGHIQINKTFLRK